MAIKVHHQPILNDGMDISDEYDAAKELVERFSSELSNYPEAKGDIYILSSITMFAQKRRDIDLLVIGFLKDFELKGKFKTINYGDIEKLKVESFIFNIELKSHPIYKVKKIGPDYFVDYKGVDHNASQQSCEAKFSLHNHLQSNLNINSFIADFLWFRSISKENLKNLRNGVPDNALYNIFSFKDLISTALFQIEVRNNSGLSLNSFPEGENNYKSILNLFTQKRQAKGLTKKKFEMLSQQATSVDNLINQAGDKFTIMTGRAGTGKTVQLLQLAFKLADTDNQKRCLMLTYNNALVSDIQRLIDYTPMPSRIDGRTVSIRTIHSFFQSLMVETGVIKSNLNPMDYNYNILYNEGLKSLYKYVVEECQKEDIDFLKDLAKNAIDWDFILIDEAQDFEDIEKEILFKIYGPKRIIVADGVDQFMRCTVKQNWDASLKKSDVYKPKRLELERRQKTNLVRFVNAFAQMSGLDWQVKPNENIPGGIVKIYKQYNTNIHIALTKNCKDNECENYDILILEPPTQIIKKDGFSAFKKADIYSQNNIKLFDGTNSRNRTTYPTKGECRLYQYDSCRGLEGWCVVCDNFDELYKYKMDTYKDDDHSLGLDKEKIKRRNVLLWMLMPLTRPIDTLIIILNDPNTEIGMMLKEMSEKFQDFVEWNLN